MTNVQTRNGSCPCCHALVDLLFAPYIDLFWQSSDVFKDQVVTYCPLCGFGYAIPEIAPETMNDFYTKIYRAEDSPVATNFPSLSMPLAYDYRSMAQLILARHFVQFESGDAFLDIGPGWGGGFFSAQQVLINPKLYAVELGEGAASAYRRLYSVQTFRSLEEFAAQGCRPKIILSSHSLEHFQVDELPGFLGAIRKLLAPDGVLIIEVPHVDFRIHKEVRGFDSPHMLFFSKESLGRVLSESGYEVIFLNTCAAKYQTLGFGTQRPQSIVEIAKIFLSRMPRVRAIAIRLYQKLRIKRIDLRRGEFSYGGNRDCLRVVARSRISN